jgi:hypothetical protein
VGEPLVESLPELTAPLEGGGELPLDEVADGVEGVVGVLDEQAAATTTPPMAAANAMNETGFMRTGSVPTGVNGKFARAMRAPSFRTYGPKNKEIVHRCASERPAGAQARARPKREPLRAEIGVNRSVTLKDWRIKYTFAGEPQKGRFLRK